MTEKKKIERARKKKREGKAPTTQAVEFVREEIKHVRKGKHGARATKQAIAIGLSKARKAGVDVPPKGKAAKKISKARSGGRKKSSSSKLGGKKKTSARRSQATPRALKREGRQAASHKALSRQATQAAHKRKPAGKKKGGKKKSPKRSS